MTAHMAEFGMSTMAPASSSTFCVRGLPGPAKSTIPSLEMVTPRIAHRKVGLPLQLGRERGDQRSCGETAHVNEAGVLVGTVDVDRGPGREIPRALLRRLR